MWKSFMLSNEKKHKIFLKLRTENYQASLRLEGLDNHRSVSNISESTLSEEIMTMTTITHAIHNDTDYKAVLKEIEDLMAAEVGTPEGDRLEVLVSIIENYEAEQSMD
jgi:hypothetical protein